MQGKTIVVECLAEHWASRAHRWYSLTTRLFRSLMLDRRMSRHTSLPVYQALRSGTLTPEHAKVKDDAATADGMGRWHNLPTTPGWTMEQTTAELRKLHAEGLCDVAGLTTSKRWRSPRQLKMFGANAGAEADNVEQLKDVCGAVRNPGGDGCADEQSRQGMSPDRMDRSDMTGSADKSNKGQPRCVAQA